jgi:hypothetical protein
MATDQRISALPSITSPLSTDVLPIVSAGATSQVTVGNLHSTLATTGSNTFVGTQIINGNLSITGTTILGGNIIPATPRGATLGTLTYPFEDIFVSSGSINIAGIVGQPNTTLSNVSGNILISAGGMQLIGSGAFNAATGSFQFISGSMEQIGNYTQTGNYVMNGNKTITGSLNISGSGKINQHRILTDLDTGSFVTTGSNVFVSGQTITGSLNVTGSITVTGSINLGQTSQTNISKTSILNPSNYVIHQFLTSSYHGANYNFVVTEDSNGKSSTYNVLVAQGNNKVDKITSYLIKSEGSSPVPSISTAINGSNVELRVSDTGTFTYKGVVQLF